MLLDSNSILLLLKIAFSWPDSVLARKNRGLLRKYSRRRSQIIPERFASSAGFSQLKLIRSRFFLSRGPPGSLLRALSPIPSALRPFLLCRRGSRYLYVMHILMNVPQRLTFYFLGERWLTQANRRLCANVIADILLSMLQS